MVVCASCAKAEPAVNLKRCAKCQTTQYCSKDCQKSDWKLHKKICGKQAGEKDNASPMGGASQSGSGLSPPKGLSQPIDRPFSRLLNKTWIHDRPEKDVFALLVDSFRLRVDDDTKFGGNTGPPDIHVGFAQFLNQAVSRAALLPPWWSDKKQQACESFSRGDQWAKLGRSADKAAIIDHYGDSQFPMQLRMFAEQVIGTGPGGQSGKGMITMMAGMEEGTGSHPYMTHMDISSLFS